MDCEDIGAVDDGSFKGGDVEVEGDVVLDTIELI